MGGEGYWGSVEIVHMPRGSILHATRASQVPSNSIGLLHWFVLVALVFAVVLALVALVPPARHWFRLPA